MSQLADNPGQGNRGGQEYGEENFHKSGRNQDSQRHETTPEEEKLKQAHHEAMDNENNDDDEKEDDDQFSPGEDEDYDGRDFATD